VLFVLYGGIKHNKPGKVKMIKSSAVNIWKEVLIDIFLKPAAQQHLMWHHLLIHLALIGV